MVNPLVSIIIPHYDERELLQECLEAFEDREYEPIELIVVDNGSSDGSRQMVRENFPEVKLVEVPEDASFGRVNNAGLEAAAGDFLCFTFNNDEVIEPGWIRKIVDVLRDNPDIGIASGLRLRYDQRDIVDSAGVVYNAFGKQSRYAGKLHEKLSNQKLRSVDFVEVPVFRRELLEEVGYVDEAYGHYAEDADFCLRAKQRGYEVVTVLDAITYHRRGATTKRSRESFYYMDRSRLRLIVKLFPIQMLLPSLLYWCVIRPVPKSLLFLAGVRVKDDSLSLFGKLAVRARYVRMIYAAMWWNLLNLPQTLHERRYPYIEFASDSPPNQ